MSKIFRFDCYPHDWLLDTARLTPEDRGIYVQIVMMIYARGGAIDNDPKWISGPCNCSSRLVAASISRLTQLGFIQVSDGKITQKRAEREMNTKRTQIESGANGGRKSAETRTELSKISNITPRVYEESLSSSNPTPNPIKDNPPNPLSDRNRLVYEIPDEWKKGAMLETGWSESITADIWTNFGAHYRNKPGQAGFRTDDEWRSLWMTWCRTQRIPAATAAKPAESQVTEDINSREFIEKQKKFYRKMRKAHPIYNPTGEGFHDASH